MNVKQAITQRHAVQAGLDRSLGIDRKKTAQKAHWAANDRAFDAPVIFEG